MKTSNTKRALAFWLAVAMLAGSAPAALAAEFGAPAQVQTNDASAAGTETQPGDNTPVAPTAPTISNLQLSGNSVTVDGKTAKTVTATATLSAEGTVEWSVDDQTIQITESTATTAEGTVTKTATITVPANAVAKDYTITAKVGDSTKTATLTVTRAASVIDEIQKVYAGNVDNVDVTNGISLEAGEDVTLTEVAGLDQYDESIALSDFEVTVKTRSNCVSVDGKKITGVTAGDAVVTVRANNKTKDVHVSVKAEASEDVTLTIEDSLDKTYNGEPVANPTVKVGDTVTTEGLTFEYRSLAKNNADPLTTPPTDAGRYQLTVWYENGEQHASATKEFTIAPASLAITGLTATGRTYAPGDKTVALTGGTLDGKIGQDTVECTMPTSGTMADDTAGNDKSVTVVTPSLTGADAENYTLKPITGITVDIAKAKYTADGVSNNALEVSVNAKKGSTVYGAIPNAMAKVHTSYKVGKETDPEHILKEILRMSGDSLEIPVRSLAKTGETASVPVTVSFQNYEDVTVTYKVTVVDKKDVSSSITFKDKTFTYDGSSKSLDMPEIDGYTGGTWTFATINVKTGTQSNGMPSFTQPGTYRVRATWEDDHNIGSKEATLTINPADESTISIHEVKQLGSGKDDNYNNFDVKLKDETDGYARVYADADDDLESQKINGTSSEWIGMKVFPKVGGSSTTNLWVSTNKSDWEKLENKWDSADFFIKEVDSDSFELWYDTDDRDCSDSLYLATDAKGSNLFELEIDFDSYSGSSSGGGSGSSSSDTSKVDGDYVSVTTIDKTPSVSKDSATVSISSSAMSDALDENKREARREDADKTYIELDVKTSKTVDDTTITVPRSSLDKLADEDTGLILTTNHGTVTFDDRALAEIYDTCDRSDVKFYIEEDDDQYTLLIKDGSDEVIDLGNGEAEITFNYKLKSGESASDVKVYRTGDGDKKFDKAVDMKADYSSSKKKATFTTDVLGTFLVTTDEHETGSGDTDLPSYTNFIDVPASRWSAPYINQLASLGVINGTGGGYFEPTLYVTREEFVKMLAGVAGANVNGYTSSRFPDVPMSRWSAPYIAWAADRGITTGTDGGRFAPTMKITREEMATMIYRYVQSAGETLPQKNAPVIFADADRIDGWAQTPVSVMQQAGIIDGNVTNGRYTFDPMVPATREECAKMLAVLYDLL